MSFLSIPIADNTNIRLAKSADSIGTGVVLKAFITEISHIKAAATNYAIRFIILLLLLNNGYTSSTQIMYASFNVLPKGTSFHQLLIA